MTEDIFISKYRPTTLAEVMGQEHVTIPLNNMIEAGHLPHLLLAGPSGTGKTTVAKIVAEMTGANMIEINASDDRGIDVVREKIKNFARTMNIQGAPFNLIFLDEADGLTRDAQQALRATMEKYSSNTRFIISCNWLDKIINPIIGRCAVFRFRPVSVNSIEEVVIRVANAEGMKTTTVGVRLLAERAAGDVRAALNILTVVQYGYGEISKTNVEAATHKVLPYATVEKLLRGLTRGENKKKWLENADKFVANLYYGGYGYRQTLGYMMDWIGNTDRVSPEVRTAFIVRLAEVDMAIKGGAFEQLQMRGLMYYLVERS